MKVLAIPNLNTVEWKEDMIKQKVAQSGQILLITLLILAVGTTIALSLLGRSTQDLSISREIEESSRAFSAAEAGVERALQSGSGTGGPQTLTPGISYDVLVSTIGGASGVYTFPKKTPKTITDTLWLVPHDDDDSDGDGDRTELIETPYYTSSTIELCWSSETIVPALVVSVIYKEQTDGSYQVAKFTLDKDNSRGNNFITVGVPGNHCGQTNVYSRTIDFLADLNVTANADTLLAMRIRPVYSDTQLSIDTSGQVLPQQGKKIESTGTTTTGINRKILVYQQYRSASSIFDAAVFSQNTFRH
ncbi:hypothetical protein HY409_00270 [Candidatus Gottesmanbacteria bacterium]|nr:hypothetical protein [Candidatus Gottesmanbacteria bacterium]